jgi:hypothetical protein
MATAPLTTTATTAAAATTAGSKEGDKEGKSFWVGGGYGIGGRVTRCVANGFLKKIVQNVTQPISLSKSMHSFSMEKYLCM